MSEESQRTLGNGPLSGTRIVEFAGIGPVPFAGMLLSDLGAEIVRIDRIGTVNDPREAVNRGRRFAQLDLKSPEAIQQVVRLCRSADALIEGFRPGVMERLGIGPRELLQDNPRLVYGRMTGWGQNGPLANRAGHDINYIAISGALAAIGTSETPIIPLNLVGDYGGGSLYLVMSVLAALLETRSSGVGQVVDVAMCDGAASLMSMFSSMSGMGIWREERGRNIIDGGSHFYNVYECADEKFISVGAIEPAFYQLLLEIIDSDTPALSQNDPLSWSIQKRHFKDIFKTRTQAEWCVLLEGTDACFAPVLTMAEAPVHPHYLARGSFIERNGVKQPAPVPRYSRTPCQVQELEGSDSDLSEILARWQPEPRRGPHP